MAHKAEPVREVDADHESPVAPDLLKDSHPMRNHPGIRCLPRLVVALASLALALHASAQATIGVLQTNIHRDIGGSDSLISAQPFLAQEINYLRPDVWTLQELGGNDVTYNAATAYSSLVSFVRSDLTIFGVNPVVGTNFFVYLSTRDDNYDTVAIVSRYPILSSQTYSDAGGGNGALRGLARVTLDIPGSINLDIFTMHLKALNTDADAQRRQAEADANRATLANWINTHPTDAVIATGDLNETIERTASTNWSGHALGDAITLANGTVEAYNPVGTLLSAGFTDPRPASIKGNVNTISANNPNARFDYVLAGPRTQYLSGQVFDTKQFSSGQLAALNAQAGTTFTSSTSANASDHLAVFSTFAIVPEPGSLALLGVAALVFLARRRRD